MSVVFTVNNSNYYVRWRATNQPHKCTKIKYKILMQNNNKALTCFHKTTFKRTFHTAVSLSVYSFSTTSTKRSSMEERNSAEKRSSTERRSSILQPKIDKPFWQLQTVFNKDGNVSVNKDQTREKQIREIKGKWYESNPDRYEKSQRLRLVTEMW